MEPDRYRYFRLEARELLDQFGEGIIALEKGEGATASVQRLLRLAHTLKGAARVVKQSEIAERAHAIEDALSPFREAGDGIPRDRVAAILKHLEDIASGVAALTPLDGTSVKPASNPAGEESVRTIRAEITEMDALLDRVLEAHALLGGLRSATRSIEQAQRLADLIAEQLAPGLPTSGSRPVSTNADKTYAMAEELQRSFGGLDRTLGATVERMDRELWQLRDAAEQLRLVPAGALFTPLERTARDAAQALDKEIAFQGSGGDIRLDAHVLSTVQGALVQIVRNAVAHGIETRAGRHAAGKPAAGRITLDVSRRGSRIVFECSDDGGGIDLEAVRRVAVRRGLASAAARNLSAEDLVRLLLHGGISTSEAVTEVSGRGIGLDVVREAVDRLGGTIAVRTRPDSGTAFELVMPLSLVSIEALVVEAAGFVATIPLDAVRGAMRVPADAISRTASGAAVLYGSEAIPFLPLARLLDGARPEAATAWSSVVVAGANRMIALGVDHLLGTSTVVMRPLPELVPLGSMVAGASLDAEGKPQLVLDPDRLVAAAIGHAAESEPMPTRQPVLVVDDSLTTRMLEQSILESAGYEVSIATSGEEALEMARRNRYALFLVDVEMPGMDGIGFVEQTRSDPALRDIPAVLVTSRAAPEDRQRGRDAGALGYIVKSEFDQAELLTMIRRLMGSP